MKSSVFGMAKCLEVFYAPAGTDILHDDFFVRVEMLGNELQDRSPNHFLCGITEDSRRSIIPACDDSIEVLAEDYVVR